MIVITPELAAHIAGNQTTLTTILKVTRQDGEVFGFTEHDKDIEFENLVYRSSKAYSQSATQWGDDLSPTNLEVYALIDGVIIKKQDVEAGLWDFAQVDLGMVNYMDLSMGSLPLNSGIMGQVEIRRGEFRAELRGLSQLMAQNIGEIYSAGCRATFGDAKCQVDLTSLTFTGISVTALQNKRVFTAASLTQTGPTLQYLSDVYNIPSSGGYSLTPLVPEGGLWISDGGVTFRDTGTPLTAVTSLPTSGQYTVVNGVYTFNVIDAGKGVNFLLNYAQGYFTYGKVKWLTGNNTGYSADVWRFSYGGLVTLLTPMTYPIEVGDTFEIIAGCDKTFQTCKLRYLNVINFRGEPYLPGLDNIIKIQSKR